MARGVRREISVTECSSNRFEESTLRQRPPWWAMAGGVGAIGAAMVGATAGTTAGTTAKFVKFFIMSLTEMPSVFFFFE